MPVHENADDDLFEWIIDHRGRPAKIVRAGVTYRVPTMMRDSLSPVQQAIIADRQRVVDAAGDAGFALNRPGSRMLADRSAYDAVADAYDEMCRASEVAWKAGPGQQLDADPPPNAFGSFEPHRLGQTCTLNGADGRLEASADGKWLICRPIAQRNDSAPAWHPGLSFADAERIKQEAWEMATRDREQAWQRLGLS